jgi:hypothetical protein
MAIVGVCRPTSAALECQFIVARSAGRRGRGSPSELVRPRDGNALSAAASRGERGYSCRFRRHTNACKAAYASRMMLLQSTGTRETKRKTLGRPPRLASPKGRLGLRGRRATADFVCSSFVAPPIRRGREATTGGDTSTGGRRSTPGPTNDRRRPPVPLCSRASSQG